jgi:cell division protein FtsI (penicillin-binding protein 3)
MAKKDIEIRKEKEKRRPSRVLMHFYMLFLAVSLVVIGKIIYIQYIWEPNPKFVKDFKPAKQKEVIEPERGSILDHNGRLLAISTPLYNIRMDCYVQKEHNEQDGEKGRKAEEKWLENARLLSGGLARVLHEPDKDSLYYWNLIRKSRAEKKKYVSIARNIDHGTLLELQELPLYNLPRHKGGLIVEKVERRLYPYGSLARRVIGYVRNNDDTSAIHVGIEGKYHYLLHGRKGVEWTKKTDKSSRIQDIDSTYISAEDGADVRTTLDINIQDIADKALKKSMSANQNIKEGCVVIMDVETGAIRAMVNLEKDSQGGYYESFNMAAGRPAEPGSVFKAVTLTTLLEDKKVELDTRIPTKRGIMEEYPLKEVAQDQYIVNYENNTKEKTIPVIHGFQISSNYVFRRLVKDHYGENPEEFTSRLHSYNLGANFDFELTEKGSGKPSIPDPQERGWSRTSLISSAIGYSVKVTPLQIATFYNAIANDGKMMKPYIVECTERNGVAEKTYGPMLLNSICSKATADTLTRALKRVTSDGTAKVLRNARCQVAGKTGTARMYLTPQEEKGSGNPYEDIDGKKKHQGTFVGFFPADEPKYTAIVVTYTGLLGMGENVYGGAAAAATFKDIVDGVWSYETEWSHELEADGNIPEMKAKNITVDRTDGSPVPDVTGMGLMDALYAIENCGYICEYSGSGHVRSQNPSAGTVTRKGQTIKIVLE